MPTLGSIGQGLLSGNVRVIGLDIVNAKLLKAAPAILLENRTMVKEMLAFVKDETRANTPTGPGHFGYHLRDSFTTDVKSGAIKTSGRLLSPPTGYWREYGTGGRFRGPKASALRSYVGAFTARNYGTGGERAFRTAHHALSGIKRFIAFYYGSAQWWRA